MTRQERWIYRDMLDIIYDTEQPLPDSLEKICVILGVRTDDEKRIVAELLMYKFNQVEGGYMNQRAAQEIQEYQDGLCKASAAGRASAAKRSAEKQRKLNESKTIDAQVLNNSSTTDQHNSNECSTTVERPLNECSTNQEPVTSNQDKPPQTPQGGNVDKKERRVRLQTFLDSCKTKNERPLRDYAPLWTYCESAKIPSDYIALAWVEFCRRFTGEGTDSSTVQLDWRKKFFKYVQGNYFRLWAYSQDGDIYLTTQGKQAQNVHMEKAA